MRAVLTNLSFHEINLDTNLKALPAPIGSLQIQFGDLYNLTDKKVIDWLVNDVSKYMVRVPS